LTEQHERTPSTATSVLRSVPRGVPSSSISTLLRAFLPSEHDLGPLSSAIRLSRRLSAYFSPPTRVKHKTRFNDDLHTRATKVLDLLQHASSLGHLDATYKLAELSLFPPSPYFPSDPSIAFKLYNTHARSTGNASSQAILAFFYATGHSGATTRDAAKAQLFYTFAAHGNSRAAQQALGYRHWAGIGTSQDCMRAMEWYSNAAEQCQFILQMNYFRADPVPY
jgi:SEL1 protein